MRERTELSIREEGKGQKDIGDRTPRVHLLSSGYSVPGVIIWKDNRSAVVEEVNAIHTE